MGKKNYHKSHYGAYREGYRGALLRMLPVLIMAGIVPLIVRQYKFETGLTQYPWFDNEEISYEFFLASKAFVLMLLAFVMAACVCVRLWKERRRIPFAKLLIPLFGYGLLAFLSACVSVNRTFSFYGGFEQFESVWTLLSYVLAVYYVFLYAQSEQELQVLADAICFGATVVGLIGKFQGLGLDLFATKFFQKLITTDTFLNAIGGELSLNFTDKNAFATMYNPNYLGVYGSFAVPFLVMLLLFEKNKWRRVWHGCNFVLVSVALLSSRSRAGLIAAVAAICVAAVFSIRKVLKWWYLTIPAINFAVVLVLLVNAYNDNLIFDRLKNILAPDNVTVTEEIADDGTVIRKTGLTQMNTAPDGVVFTYNEISVQASLYVGEGIYGFYAINETGEQETLVPNEEGTEFLFSNPALAGVKISPVYFGEKLGMKINAGGEWNFVYNEAKGKYQYITGFGKESDMIRAESFGFENYQSFFSHRGHIWSRTLPLLKDYVFLGSGPDTFLLVYPQEDYLAMRQNGFENHVMTKPHSMYLQVAVQTGVLSLLCLLVFYGWYAVWSMRLYAFRKLNLQIEAFGMAAFIGSIGYMVSGISNDSMVVTAPVFWCMIGLGVAANGLTAKLRKQNKAEAGKNPGIKQV